MRGDSDLAADMEDVYCFGGNPLDRASERKKDVIISWTTR